MLGVCSSVATVLMMLVQMRRKGGPGIPTVWCNIGRVRSLHLPRSLALAIGQHMIPSLLVLGFGHSTTESLYRQHPLPSTYLAVCCHSKAAP